MKLNSMQLFILKSAKTHDVYKCNVLNSLQYMFPSSTDSLIEAEFEINLFDLINNKFLLVENDRIKILFNGVQYLRYEQNRIENKALNDI